MSANCRHKLIKLCSENMKGKDHLEDTGIEGDDIKIDLREIGVGGYGLD
jgi:hypothetical protein